MNIARRLSRKGADIAAIAKQVIDRPEAVEEFIEGLLAPKGTQRYGCDKVLREVCVRRPDLVYPYFDVFVELLDNGNNILKWGAILTIGNLAAADSEGRFEKIFRKYYAPVTGPALVTSANIIKSSVKIISAKPELSRRITREIMKVEKAEFERHGEPSPECRNVALGHAIETLDQVFDRIVNKTAVVRFVKRQLDNPRLQVARKARTFLAKHDTAN